MKKNYVLFKMFLNHSYIFLVLYILQILSVLIYIFMATYSYIPMKTIYVICLLKFQIINDDVKFCQEF